MKSKNELKTELLMLAAHVRDRAYAPYSHYQVGAAVLGKSGRIYTGCNVENASYGLTVCAERNAIFKGISEGEKEFTAIAIVTANGGSPCGACRQVEFEFMHPDAQVYLSDEDLKNVQASTIGELLPDGFTPRKLREGQRKEAATHAPGSPRKIYAQANNDPTTTELWRNFRDGNVLLP